MESPAIQQTTDYNIFKIVNFNRDKTVAHIEETKRVIRKENLLHLHPIIVNEKMEVIDGQHRLMAAQELQIPIFYIQGNVSYDHILDSNLFQKKMNLSDVIKFYAVKDQKPEYVRLKEYLKAMRISVKALIGLLFGMRSHEIERLLKRGIFQFPADEFAISNLINQYLKFKEFVTQKRITPLYMFAGCSFCVAYRNLILCENFDIKLFFNKLDQCWFKLKPQPTMEFWTRSLLDIYNWKNHNPLDIPFDRD